MSPLLDCTSRDSTPAQVACSWTFSIVLTESGDLFGGVADFSALDTLKADEVSQSVNPWAILNLNLRYLLGHRSSA